MKKIRGIISILMAICILIGSIPSISLANTNHENEIETKIEQIKEKTEEEAEEPEETIVESISEDREIDGKDSLLKEENALPRDFEQKEDILKEDNDTSFANMIKDRMEVVITDILGDNDTGSLVVFNTNIKGEVLNGNSFVLTNKESNEIKTGITKEGNIIFKDLKEGNYELEQKSIKDDEQYNKNEKIWKVNVDSKGNIEIKNASKFEIIDFKNGEEKTSKSLKKSANDKEVVKNKVLKKIKEIDVLKVFEHFGKIDSEELKKRIKILWVVNEFKNKDDGLEADIRGYTGNIYKIRSTYSQIHVKVSKMENEYGNTFNFKGKLVKPRRGVACYNMDGFYFAIQSPTSIYYKEVKQDYNMYNYINGKDSDHVKGKTPEEKNEYLKKVMTELYYLGHEKIKEENGSRPKAFEKKENGEYKYGSKKLKESVAKLEELFKDSEYQKEALGMFELFEKEEEYLRETIEVNLLQYAFQLAVWYFTDGLSYDVISEKLTKKGKTHSLITTDEIKEPIYNYTIALIEEVKNENNDIILPIDKDIRFYIPYSYNQGFAGNYKAYQYFLDIYFGKEFDKTLKFRKIDKYSKDGIDNVTFKLMRKNNSGNWEEVNTITSNKDGYFELKIRKPGDYQLVEKVKPGYFGGKTEKVVSEFSFDKKLNFKGDWELNEVKTIENVRTDLRFRKIDTDTKNGIIGIKFPVYKENIDGSWKYLGFYSSKTAEVNGEDGMVIINKLTTGRYKVFEINDETELNMDKGYYLPEREIFEFNIKDESGNIKIYKVDKNGNEKEWEQEKDGIVENKKIKIKLEKLSFDTGEPLKGVEFKLIKTEGREEKTKISESDDKGIVEFIGLQNGKYRIEEVAPLDGYLKTKEKIYLEVKQEEDGLGYIINRLDEKGNFIEEWDTKKPVKFLNYKNSIKFKKIDKKTNEILKGVKFDLEKFDGEISNDNLADILKNKNWTKIKADIESDKDGEIKFEDIKKGVYRIIETKPLEGYFKPKIPVKYFIYDGDDFKEIVVKDGKIIKIDWEAGSSWYINNEKTEIEFEKIYNDNGTIRQLEGATFILEKKDKSGKYNKYGETKISDSKGHFKFENMTEGEYRLKEVKIPGGFILPDKESDNIIKHFRIDQNNKKWLIDKNGEETEWKDTDFKILNLKLPNIKFKKTDENNKALKDVEFELYKKDGEKWSAIKDENGKNIVKKSDENGNFGFEKLNIGMYKVVEKKALDGYIKPIDGVFYFNVYRDGDALKIQRVKKVKENLLPNIENQIKNFKKIKLKVVKQNIANPNELMKGTELALEKFNSKSKKWVAIENKKITTTNNLVLGEKNGLEEGDYRVIETKSKEGFVKPMKPVLEFKILIDSETGELKVKKIKRVNAVDNNGNTILDGNGEIVQKIVYVDWNYKGTEEKIYNMVKDKYKLTIRKIDKNGKLLDGAIFNISSGNGMFDKDIVVKNGEYTLTGLIEGVYTITEKKSPSGYDRETKPIIVKVGPTSTNLEKTGVDLGNVAEFKDVKLTGSNGDLKINPNNLDYLRLNSKIKIKKNEINAGDYFNVKMSDFLTIDEILKNKTFNIYAEHGLLAVGKEVVGEGNDKKIEFVFTDYPRYYDLSKENKKLSMYIDQNIYIDKKYFKEKFDVKKYKREKYIDKDILSKQFKFDSISKEINIDFANSISGSYWYNEPKNEFGNISGGCISKIDLENQEYEMTFYLNADKAAAKPMYRSGIKIDKNVELVKIYRDDKDEFPVNFDFDTTNKCTEISLTEDKIKNEAISTIIDLDNSLGKSSGIVVVRAKYFPGEENNEISWKTRRYRKKDYNVGYDEKNQDAFITEGSIDLSALDEIFKNNLVNKDGDHLISVINKKSKPNKIVIPMTGITKKIPYIGAGLAIIAIAYVLLHKKNK